MEESKLRTHRRPSVGSGRPVRRGASAAGSSHVIDLRTAKPAAPSGNPSASKPARKPKAARRPLAAPNQSAVPVAAAPEALEPETLAKTKSSAAPLASVAPISPSASTPMSEPTLPPRRFWPAFWRFLLLLVILALLVVGGVYLYINYYRG